MLAAEEAKKKAEESDSEVDEIELMIQRAASARIIYR